MASEGGKQAEQAVRVYLRSLGKGIDEVMKGYGTDAIMLTPDGPRHGLTEIREYYEDFLRDTLPLLAASFSLKRFDVIGEAAYLSWDALPSITLGTDTFLVHKGMIVLHTTSLYIQP